MPNKKVVFQKLLMKVTFVYISDSFFTQLQAFKLLWH